MKSRDKVYSTMGMLQTNEQQKMSEFANLYERLIPQDNTLRRMNDLVDYGFVREELREKYCLDNGRNAVDPAQMFKYLLLKAMYNLSDQDLVEHCMYDVLQIFSQLAPRGRGDKFQQPDKIS